MSAVRKTMLVGYMACGIGFQELGVNLYVVNDIYHQGHKASHKHKILGLGEGVHSLQIELIHKYP